MSTITTEQTISEIAAQTPSSIRVFENLGIDYCCGGKRTLTVAAAKAGVTVDSIVKLLDDAERGNPPSTQNWLEAPLTALIAEIVDRHHSFVRREIPRLNALAAKVAKRHGGAGHPEAVEIESTFGALGDELTLHLMKEEQILFPYIGGMAAQGTPPAACFGTVQAPIANMVAEHEDAGALLEKLRELTNAYQPPTDACPSFQALYTGLADFERDLHRHIHLENNILFPRAVEMERAH